MTHTLKTRLCSLAALLMLAVATATAQRAPDFAEKFVSQCKGDTMVTCVTVSPKMMEQLAGRADSSHEADMAMAIQKLRSMRIVSAPKGYYERAEKLLKKNARRFRAMHDFRSDKLRGAFYSRTNRKGQTVELIMLRENLTDGRLTVVCLTGDIDTEFLCFLYNNKSFKD